MSSYCNATSSRNWRLQEATGDRVDEGDTMEEGDTGLTGSTVLKTENGMPH